VGKITYNDNDCYILPEGSECKLMVRKKVLRQKIKREKLEGAWPKE
jgi:hypothetical protein